MGGASDTLDIQPWLDLEKEAYDCESARDDFAGGGYDEAASRNRLDPLDDGTKRLLITAIRHWRTLETQTFNQRENLTKYWNAWRGGDEDSDEFGQEDENRPVIDDWLIHTREFLNQRWPLYNSLVSFSKFCPSEIVKQYLAHMEDEYRVLVEESPGRIAQVENNLEVMSAAATTKVVIRTREGRERAEARQAEHERAERESLGEAEAARIAREEEEEDRLRQGDLDPRLGWVGAFPLGSGAQGSVNFHIKQDRYGRIIDRLAIKNARWPAPGNPLRWVNGQENGVPFAIQALYELRCLVGSESVIKIRNWRQSTEKGEFRQYLEYCPFSDLHKLIATTENGFKDQPRTLLPNKNFTLLNERGEREPPKFIPEPFIWYVLDRLSIAGLLMERGELARYGLKSWHVIMHRDIKNANMFLGSHSPKQFRNYPTPKLGDWDMAIPLNDEISSRREDRQGGTVGWKAPELTRESAGEASSKSNVWGVGVVAWSLVACTINGFEPAIFTDDVVPPPIDESAKAYYSPVLLELIRSCTEFRAEDRPTFDEMRATILRHTSGGPNDLAQGLRSLPKDDPKWREDGVALPPFYLAEKFGLQKALDQVQLSTEQKLVYPQGVPKPHVEEGRVEDYGGRMAEEILGKRKAAHNIPPAKTDGGAGPSQKKKSRAREGEEEWVIVGNE